MPTNVTSRLTAADRLAARHAHVQWEERRDAIAALLATPLISAEGAGAESFRSVRLHADWLKKWFLRWPGWTLVVAADVARLRKVSSPRKDATRALVDKSSSNERTYFTRRRYGLLCLVLATLESEQRQTTIQQVAVKTETSIRIDRELQELGFDFDTKQLAHRRELVAVLRFLQQQQVLLRTDGDDSQYVKGDGDCLYRIQRTALSAILCSARGASTIPAANLDEWIDRLNEIETPESPEAQNRQLQHKLVRRLLDDPVMYFNDLTLREHEYYTAQGERLTRELAQTTGMVVERRAEGVALLDPNGDWTDLGLPETGTRGHATLLLAEWLGEKLRHCDQAECRVAHGTVYEYMAELADKHKSRWRKNVATPEGTKQILRDSLDILQSLSLIEIVGETIVPRPAIARYRLGELLSGSETGTVKRSDNDAARAVVS